MDSTNTVEDNLINFTVSSTESTIVVFLLNEVMPWTLHTVSALLSAAVVTLGIFFLNRWLKNKYK